MWSHPDDLHSNLSPCLLCRLFNHSTSKGPLVLLHEIDLCVVGISSLDFGGPHYTSLGVGSMEATTHVIHISAAADGFPEPPQAKCLVLLST